jgi:hypothetical protein
MTQFAALSPTIELVYFGFAVCHQVVRVLVSGYITDHSDDSTELYWFYYKVHFTHRKLFNYCSFTISKESNNVTFGYFMVGNSPKRGDKIICKNH